MEQGLYMSALRGWDATGVALVGDPHKIPIVYKKAMSSCDFIGLKRTQKLLDTVENYQAVLGHTRSATLRGNSQDENAHPFQFDHITLIHNGHVHNYRTLGAKCDIEVDSAHVAAAIAQKGETDTLERIQGDYALVWHNAQDQTINIARNQGRPFHYVDLPEWDGIAFASEFEMLGCLLARNGIKISQDKFKYPKEHVHFKFSLTKELVKTGTPFRQGGRLGDHRNRGITEETSGSHTSTDTEETTLTRGTTPLTPGESKDLIAILEKQNKSRPDKRANSGRPTSIKGTAKAAQKLSTMGFDYNQTVGCDTTKFVPYKNNKNLGMAIVSLFGPKYKGLIGEIQNITSEVFDAISDQGRFVHTRAVNVKNYKENKKTIVLELDPDFVKKAVADMREELELVGKEYLRDLKYDGPGGRQISYPRFLELTKSGCGYCETVLDPAGHKSIHWLDNCPLCNDCYNDEAVADQLGFRAPANGGRKGMLN